MNLKIKQDIVQDPNTGRQRRKVVFDDELEKDESGESDSETDDNDDDEDAEGQSGSEEDSADELDGKETNKDDTVSS